MSAASCLCCGKVGEPKAWKIDDPSTYVCVRCHRRATLPTPEYATEAEGDAYTHGWFDGNEAEPYGVTLPDGEGVDASDADAAPAALPAVQRPPKEAP